MTGHKASIPQGVQDSRRRWIIAVNAVAISRQWYFFSRVGNYLACFG